MVLPAYSILPRILDARGAGEVPGQTSQRSESPYCKGNSRKEINTKARRARSSCFVFFATSCFITPPPSTSPAAIPSSGSTRNARCVRGRPRDHGGHARRLIDEFQPLLRTEHADGLGDGVGGHAAGTDDHHAAMVGQCHAGPRIDDVRITLAGDLDILNHVAGSGNRHAGKFEIAQRLGLRIVQAAECRPANRNGPAAVRPAACRRPPPPRPA